MRVSLRFLVFLLLLLEGAFCLISPHSNLFNTGRHSTEAASAASPLHATPIRPDRGLRSTNAVPYKSNIEPKLRPPTLDWATVRPLDQNWWPAATVTSLDKSKPNGIELLGNVYVVYWNGKEFKCMYDICSHRFGPLSEGNLIPSEKDGMLKLQCSNHGWEFDDTGTCKHIPQLKASPGMSINSVPTFPLQVEAGILWLWTGTGPPVTYDLPVSPLLKRWHAQFGDDAVFMRDFPCGMELVGENLLDVSQLPFLHHSIAGLDRERATSLKMKLVIPPTGGALYQASIEDAATTDPIFDSLKVDITEHATTDISFFQPNHFRIDRQREWASSQDFFLSPVAKGRTRMFYFNPMEVALENEDGSWIDPMLSSIQRTLLNPASVRYHMFTHDMFDVEGSFLQLQGDRMKRANLSYRDYSTPSSADIMVTAYQQYLEIAVQRTLEEPSKETIANSVKVVALPSGISSRPILLDRQSHTNSCRVCKGALAKTKRLHKQLDVIRTALVGAAGASSVLLAMSLVAAKQVNEVLVRTCVLSGLAATLAAIIVSQWKKSVMRRLEAFFFKDCQQSRK